jgi:hypothetical protein
MEDKMAKPIGVICPHCGTTTMVRSKRWTQVYCQSCHWMYINPSLETTFKIQMLLLPKDSYAE